MAALTERLRTRLIPALITALGGPFIAAGLLQYTMPVEAQPGPSATPVPSLAPSATPDASASSVPTASTEPSPTPDPADRVATRVVVAALGIDLPVMAQPDADYPS